MNHSREPNRAPRVSFAIRAQGATVVVFDPRARETARRACPSLEYAESVAEACQGAHAVVHLTDWPEFQELDPSELKTTVANAVLVDARLTLDDEAWRQAGWTCFPAPAREN